MPGRRLRANPAKNQLDKMYLSENSPQGNQEPFHRRSNRPPAANSGDNRLSPRLAGGARRPVANPKPALASAFKRKTEFLSAIDERSLVWRWQKRSDYRARDALVRAFQPAIRNVALKYPSRGLDLDDRIQLGSIGLLKALDKFDIHRRLRLWTYAKDWVRAEIGAATEKNQSIVIRPRKRGKQERIVSDLALNAPVAGDGADYIDLLFDECPDHEPCHFSNQALSDALESLKPRERTIFTARRLSDEPVTLSTLAIQFQISSERVRQIEIDAAAVVSARVKEAECRPNPEFARQLTAQTFSGRGHKLSYSRYRWANFKDRSPPPQQLTLGCRP
jgi:RNA polymerase sigma-32 factor